MTKKTWLQRISTIGLRKKIHSAFFGGVLLAVLAGNPAVAQTQAQRLIDNPNSDAVIAQAEHDVYAAPSYQTAKSYLQKNQQRYTLLFTALETGSLSQVQEQVAFWVNGSVRRAENYRRLMRESERLYAESDGSGDPDVFPGSAEYHNAMLEYSKIFFNYRFLNSIVVVAHHEGHIYPYLSEVQKGAAEIQEILESLH